ncbi:hypothetical protein NPIL_87721 [Nephila pilipes]|uniref:Uncharacterized protein n=1 Tax=Nephila pilipes TaxID=299642 RepID=A0A8X6TSN3_NEPPI|nr:hypothetical protein NPIL_87721 [Nephila pilipes]
MAVEEFEMEQIIERNENGEGDELKSRSLVFRISKRINKSTKKVEFPELTSDSEMVDSSKKVFKSSEGKALNPADAPIQCNADLQHLPQNETAEKTDLESHVDIKMPKSVVEHTENKGPTLRRTSRRIIVKPINKEFLSGPNSNKMGKRKRGRKRAASGNS